ncbi:MAG: hypothetical protein LBP83_00105 [Dysgonamonadaceae bacterium]|jgi:hypothetical protein|nr:hypothetical protein [Dysgonamonadaceae bacterium]
MKLAFKVILLFLIVFNFRIPLVYNSVFVTVILSTFYYLITKKSIPFTYFNYRHNAVIIIATLMLALVVFTFTTLHEQDIAVTIRRIFVQLSMLLALIYIFPILLEEIQESNAFEEAMLIVCYTFALQGGIHLAAYFIPALGDFMISIKPEGFQEGMAERNINRFRGFALSGSVYFELPSAYGVAFILYIRLQLIEGQKYLTGYKNYIVLLLIVSGIMLTGRVGFVGIGIGMLLYFLFVKDPIVIVGRIFKNAIAFSPFIIIGWFILLSPSQRTSIENEIFPFALEFYYRFRDTGEIGTSSSDATFKAFYFPLKDETLLWGHGTDDVYKLLDQYNFTDAGYMRTLMFGGIPYFICLFIYQFLYFSMPIKAASWLREKESKKDLYCFLFLFGYILTLHIKDTALALQHLTEVLFLYIGFSYLIKYYAKSEK